MRRIAALIAFLAFLLVERGPGVAELETLFWRKWE